MNSDPTIIESTTGAPPPGGPGTPTIIEPTTPASAGSAPTILEAPGVGPTPASGLNLVPGARFRDYALVRPLKVSSAEADLWLLERPADRRQFVLKLYRYGIHPKPEILAALRRLRREHVVEIVESGEQDERSYEIQEFITEGSLADLLKSGPVPEALARGILSELAESLAHLHAAGVLHRDLKPANVLVRSRAPLDLVLTDFGISSLSDSPLHLTSVNRTAAYCAPEALTGVVTKASDWWSLGVVLLESLAGRHPFAGLSEQVINFELVSKGIPVPPQIPQPWPLLLKGLLARDVTLRWGAEQVRAWLAGRRDLPSPSEQGPAPPGPGRKPYKFDNQDFFEPRALASALARKWSDAVKHCSWTFLADWVERELADEALAGTLRSISVQPQLSPDHKAALSILLLNPELPLIFKGQLVDLDWCRQNPAEALALAASPVPAWLKQLKKECPLEPWAARWLARRRELDSFGLPLDPALVQRLLSSSETALISAAHEHRRLFTAAAEPRLEALRQQPQLSATEAVVVLACPRELWQTAAQKTAADKLARLKAFGVQMDWQLAERLVAAENWDALRPLWEQYLALWPRRKRLCLPLSNPRFPAILDQPAPDYFDAVAIVANRLDFINSLGMRFLAMPGLNILFSAWATRMQDYQVLLQATSRPWKAPAFPSGPLHPVVNVSWEDASAFCQWLTAKERAERRIGPGDEYRLPYDLEWSHAVGLEGESGSYPIERAGAVPGIYPWGTQWPPPPNSGNLGPALGSDSFSQTAPVASFPPNRYGIYDLGTNVTEWCWDWYDPGQQLKTLRGASWFQATPQNVLSSARRSFVPGARSDSIGFRCVLVPRSSATPSPALRNAATQNQHSL